jgi:hypothetical protein
MNEFKQKPTLKQQKMTAFAVIFRMHVLLMLNKVQKMSYSGEFNLQ